MCIRDSTSAAATAAINTYNSTKPSLSAGEKIKMCIRDRDGRVDFDHVSFSYKKSGKPVLDDIDLHIRAGETIGIICLLYKSRCV